MARWVATSASITAWLSYNVDSRYTTDTLISSGDLQLFGPFCSHYGTLAQKNQSVDLLDVFNLTVSDLCKPQGLGDFIRSANMQDFLGYQFEFAIGSGSFHGSDHQPPMFGWWMVVSKLQFHPVNPDLAGGEATQIAMTGPWVATGKMFLLWSWNEKPNGFVHLEELLELTVLFQVDSKEFAVLAWSAFDEFGAELVRLFGYANSKWPTRTSNGNLGGKLSLNRTMEVFHKLSSRFKVRIGQYEGVFSIRQLELIPWLAVGLCLQPLVTGSVSCLTSAMYLKIRMNDMRLVYIVCHISFYYRIFKFNN